jgi:pyruvate/2-oxoglutarate dehydrogenase complex dihydrolipoamide acyltransferase (E2) component
MELAVAIIILLITLIVLALAVYLIATIVELGKINAGLSQVLDGVSEIATKTAPVNGVLDAINRTLVAGRDLLEGLALKKAGPDAAGLVESCFPGEGQRFLQRIGRHGAVVTIGEDYDRGAAILNSLLGGPAPPAPSAAPAAPAAPAAAAAPAPQSAPAPSWRSGGGRISLRPSSRGAKGSAPPSVPGRLSAKGSRPWE